MGHVQIPPKLILASGDAAIRHIYERTATIVDTRNLDAGQSSRWKFFSGTFIEIENRLFVATVSHAIDSYHNPSRYVITAKNGRPHPHGASIILRSIASDDDQLDVGILELDRNLFSSFDNLKAIDVSRLSVAASEQQLASLMGSLAETMRIHPMADAKWGISGTLSGFTTAAITVDEWPHLNLSKPLNPETDILVRYPDDSPNIRDDAGMQTTLPPPLGLSGGGLWIHNAAGNKLWVPDNCQLVGVQSAWFPDAKHVRLTRLSRWLDLVSTNYPDLRDALQRIDGYTVPQSRMAS